MDAKSLTNMIEKNIKNKSRKCFSLTLDNHGITN